MGDGSGSCTTEQCPSPGIGQKFISPSPSPGACTVTPCPVVAGEYYIEGTEECTTTSCTNRDTSTQYYDKQEVIIEDDCSVATCPTGKTPAANGLSCVDELKEKEKEAASDSNSPMVGAIVGSVVGVLLLVAVAGILVWVFVIRPRRLKSRRRRDLMEMHTGTDIDLDAVTNNDEPVSRPSPSIEYREKEL